MSDSDKYNNCPRCGSTHIIETDYEEDTNSSLDEDSDGRRCEECDWEGDVTELVDL